MNAELYESKEYGRSRKLYTLECAFEYFVALAVSDSFLAAVLQELGFTPAQTGIISSLISLAFLFELCSVPVIRKITRTKRFAVPIHCISQLFFLLIFLIPFLPFGASLRKTSAVLFLLTGYFGNYFVTNSIYNWGNSFVNPAKRGLFAATKEMVSLIAGVAVSLGLGVAFDRFEAAGNRRASFLFVAAAMCVFELFDFLCLLGMRDNTEQTEGAEIPKWSEVLKNTVKSAPFRKIVVLEVLIRTADYASKGFIGEYKTGPLGFSMLTVQIISVSAVLLRFFVSRPFGRFADRTSYARSVRRGLFFTLSAFLCLIFAGPELRWMIVGYVVLLSVSHAGVEQSLILMTYTYVDERFFVEATAIKCCVGGVAGFGTSLLSGKLLELTENSGNQLLGLPVHGQQLQGAVSFVLAAAALLYCLLVVEKLPKNGGKN